jgi:hypothetical protein
MSDFTYKTLESVQRVRKSLENCRNEIGNTEKKKKIDQYIRNLRRHEENLLVTNPNLLGSIPVQRFSPVKKLADLSSKKISRAGQASTDYNDFRVFADLNRASPNIVQSEMNKRFPSNTFNAQQEIWKMGKTRRNAEHETRKAEADVFTMQLLPGIKKQIEDIQFKNRMQMKEFIKLSISSKFTDEELLETVSLNLTEKLTTKNVF